MPPGILESFALILICIAAGHVLSRVEVLPRQTPAVLNAYVIYLAFPALVLAQVPKLLATTVFDWHLLIPVSAPWILFSLSAFFIFVLGRLFSFSRQTIGALILTAGLGNTSFVGFPVIEALYGDKGLGTAVIVDQAGTFLVLSTLGLLCASYFSGSGVSFRTILIRVVKFPPFIALILCLFPGVHAIYLPAQKLGSTLAPIALVSVGAQLRFDWSVLKRRSFALGLGLVFKLCLAPLSFYVIYFAWMGLRDLSTRVTILEMAMGPMITGAIVAQEFGMDTELTSLMVGIGVPGSLATLCFWYWVFG